MAIQLCASCRRWVVAGRLAADRWSVVFLYVVLHHPPPGEAAPREPECVPHLLHPAERHPIGGARVVEWDHLLLEDPVEPLGVRRVGILRLPRGRDRPAAQAIVPFLPP